MADERLERGTVSRQAFLRRHRTTGALAVFLALGVVISLALWVPSKDGSKAAELGSALLSGVVVGIALLLAEHVFSRSADERSRVAAIDVANRASGSPEPARDVNPPAGSPAAAYADPAPTRQRRSCLPSRL